MEMKSRYNNEFKIYKEDVIMWNGHIYQLLTQREDDGTYPVLKETEVNNCIKSGELKLDKHQITELTRVHCTYYILG